MFTRKLFIIPAFLALAMFTPAQEKKALPAFPKAPINIAFEDGEIGKVPPGWFFPQVCEKDGYKLAVSEDKPFAGKRCAVLSFVADKEPEGFGNIVQSVDATDYRGKRVRFKAAVRADVKGDGNSAQLWFRVDRPKDQSGFFDNMGDRPITINAWKHYQIVGDIADDAEHIVFGMMLLGKGSASIDDASFEIVDKSAKPTAETKLSVTPPAPGLTELRMAKTVRPVGAATEATFLYPLPLSYRDQAPLTFRLTVDPPACAKSVEIVDGPGENRILKLSLHNLDDRKEIKIAYSSVVLVAPTKFDKVPKAANFPKEWPSEAKLWLASTWCCDHENERIKKLAAEVRGESDDVVAVINKSLAIAKSIFAKAKGRVNNLTALEALDKQGSCTSCANLVAALLRGTGIPARVLAGYPLWSGPLQTHYIVEAYVPDYGWLPVESTMCQSPWPNHQQVNVSIVPIEHEAKAKAKMRSGVAGGVPYLTLTELEDPSVTIYSEGTLMKYCDHDCRMMRPIEAKPDEWSAAMTWAKPRWAAWLKSNPTLKDGKLTYGPDAGDMKANTIAEVRGELR